MCYAQNPSHKNNTGGPERATSPQRRRPENGRGKEEKKNNSMAPDFSMYPRCPPTPDLTNVHYNIHAPNNQPNQFLVVLDSPTIESTKKRPKTKILERSPPRAPLRSVHAAAAPVEVTCPGCGFARAPSPARPGHQPPPAPLVPGRAHTGRPRTCPCGGSARDIAEERSHTRKRAVKISSVQVGSVASG